MTVDEFTIASKGGYVLDSDGMDVLSVGATLNVNANQAAGFYQGEFTVVVNYNENY